MEKRKKNMMGRSRFPLFNIEKWKEGWHVFSLNLTIFCLAQKKQKKLSYFLSSLSSIVTIS